MFSYLIKISNHHELDKRATMKLQTYFSFHKNSRWQFYLQHHAQTFIENVIHDINI